MIRALGLKRFAGTAGVPPAREGEARKWFVESLHRDCVPAGGVAGGTPAVPANRLTGSHRLMMRGPKPI